jgi:hypothetical protein
MSNDQVIAILAVIVSLPPLPKRRSLPPFPVSISVPEMEILLVASA